MAKIVSIGFSLSGLVSLYGQTAPSTPAAAAGTGEDDTVILSPFVVDASKDRGYQAMDTLAGTRIRTNLADVGASISVMTEEMLNDIGATNNETALAYALNTEVGGPRGNFSGGVPQSSGTYSEHQLFSNPNANTRVRGLSSADDTRNYFLTDIPWDGYTVSRVDLQRGPNAILFGLGAPSGVVNATTNGADFRNHGKVDVAIDKYNSRRLVFDYNRELLPNELALRVTLLRNDQKFQQEPAFSLDQRAYGAIKYAPKFLNKNGTLFEISGNYEHGEIDSNRPRIVAPIDRLTGFWKPVSEGGTGGQTFNAYQTPRITDSASSAYVPTVQQNFASTQLNLLVNSNRSQDWVQDWVGAYGALDASGNVINTLKADGQGPWPQGGDFSLLAIKTLDQYSTSVGASLPFSSFGGYRAETINDPAVYDFYHKLLDGPNKREWTNWDVGEIHLTNTFLNDSLGYDVSYFQQRLSRGQWSALSWDNTLYMDINDTLPDGSPNPDVGRAYLNVESRVDGNQVASIDRDAWRVQGFGGYNFAEKHDGLWARILGRHRVTGVLSREDVKSDVRQRKYWDLDPASLAQFTPEPYVYGASGDNGIATTFRYYLSDDLRGQSSASGGAISNMASPFLGTQGGPISIYRFDNTWTAGTDVSPGAPWSNPNDPAGTYTQSRNPANYRGWTEAQANLVTVNSKQTVNGLSAEDYLTYSGELSDFAVKSKIFVWQGYLWKDAIVGMWGYRRDDARKYDYLAGSAYGTALDGSAGPADLRPSTYNYANPPGRIDDLETSTRNWSIAAHLNRLLGQHDFLPFNVSIYYNEGQNFQPLAGRLDAFGDPLPPPQGKTREESVLLSTKDDKYSLRVTKYKTDIYNATSTARLDVMWAFEQTLYSTADLARDFRAGRADTSQYVNSVDGDGNPGDLNKLNNQILPAWFQFEKDLAAKFPNFVAGWFAPDSTWGTDSNDTVHGRSAPGFAYTEDSHSKGYEFEFTANPTPNWRIAINAAKTEAVRENVPGAAYKAVADFVDDQMENTDVGLAPVWWPGNVFGGRNNGPYTIFRPQWLTLNALNGQSQPEIRQWRANVITNYRFSQGWLKNVGIGGGYRWEDKAIIDYAPMVTASGDYAANLDAPFYAPSQSTVDLWLSYERKLSKDITWKIQLNVFNAFGKNELIPLRASVDYAKLAGVPLTPGMTVPMRASAFTIREGLSWQLTNTFQF
jgi:hypothetical protein